MARLARLRPIFRLSTITGMQFPDAVAEIFQDGPLWLRPEWRTFDDAMLFAPPASGLYTLGLRRGIRYDGGTSCIVYIGSSVSLQRRLCYHLSRHHNYNIWQLRQAFGELSVSWWLLRELDKTWLLTIEGEAICRFERQFGTVPVCNLTVTSTTHAQRLRDMVTIAECKTEKPLALDEVGAMAGFRVRPRFCPGLGKKASQQTSCSTKVLSCLRKRSLPSTWRKANVSAG